MGIASNGRPARDALSAYVAHVSAFEPLGRDEETACARELRRAERALALALLGAGSTDAALSRLAEAVATTDGEPPAAAVALENLRSAARALSRSSAKRVAVDEEHAWQCLQALGSVPSVVAELEAALAEAVALEPAAARSVVVRSVRRERRHVERARETLLKAHLRLVIGEAKRFAGRGVPLSDLIQEGNLGLLDGIERFDPELGYRFNTYAMWWIRAKLRGCVARHGRTIRVPVRRLQAVSRLHRASREVAAELGREPTAAEVGSRVELSPGEVERLLALPAEPLRLEGLDAASEGASMADRLPDPDAVDPLEALVQSGRDELARALMTVLSDREATIIRDRFGFRTSEHTLEDIGRKMGVTRERIRQIEARALRKMRLVAETTEAPSSRPDAAEPA